MNLKDLEFKAEDFQGTDLYLQDNMFLDAFVDLANRLLAERLEKAPVVYGRSFAPNAVWSVFTTKAYKDMFRGRVVCVEENEE